MRTEVSACARLAVASAQQLDDADGGNACESACGHRQQEERAGKGRKGFDHWPAF